MRIAVNMWSTDICIYGATNILNFSSELLAEIRKAKQSYANSKSKLKFLDKTKPMMIDDSESKNRGYF